MVGDPEMDSVSQARLKLQHQVCTLTAMFLIYRPGQPNWEYTMWKFKDLSATQILCGINYGHFEASKTAVLTI